VYSTPWWGWFKLCLLCVTLGFCRILASSVAFEIEQHRQQFDTPQDLAAFQWAKAIKECELRHLLPHTVLTLGRGPTGWMVTALLPLSVLQNRLSWFAGAHASPVCSGSAAPAPPPSPLVTVIGVQPERSHTPTERQRW
jgi:hypothetical protein